MTQIPRDDAYPRHRFVYPWNEKREAACLKMAKLGMSVRDIATELNRLYPNTDPLGKKCTANAVRGKLDRLFNPRP